MRKYCFRSFLILSLWLLSLNLLAQESSFNIELTPDGDGFAGNQVLTIEAGQTIEVRVVFFEDVPDDASYEHTLVGESIAVRIEDASSYVYTSNAGGEYTLAVKSPVQGELRAEVFDSYYDDEESTNPLQIRDTLQTHIRQNIVGAEMQITLNEIADADPANFGALATVALDSRPDAGNHTLRIESDAATASLVIISPVDDMLEIKDFSDLNLAFSPRMEGDFSVYILNDESTEYSLNVIEEPAIAGLQSPVADNEGNGDDGNNRPPLPGAGGPPALSLTYGDTGFTITNVSGDIVDLSGIVFVGETGELSTERWVQYLSTSLDNIREGRCLQVYTFGAAQPPQPPECDSTLAWFSTGDRSEWFWLGDFSVQLDGEELDSCPPAPDTCRIRLP